MLYRLLQSTDTIQRLKLTFTKRLFCQKLFPAIRKFREILVTVHDTKGSIYTTTQRLEGLPTRRQSKWRRSKDVSDCLEHHIHHISSSDDQTIKCDSSALFPAALGARRRRIFHATNKFATRMHVERKKERTEVLHSRRLATSRISIARTRSRSKHSQYDDCLHTLTLRRRANEERKSL